MKTNTKATIPTLTNIVSGVSLCVLLFFSLWAGPPSAYAASQTWTNAPVTTNWQTAGNWVGLGVPGDINVTTANTVNNDIATFNTPIAGGIGGASLPIVPDDATVIGGRSRRIGGITFDTASCGAYVIWSPSTPNITDGSSTLTTGYLYVSQTNAIQITPTVVNSQAVIVPLLVNLPASTPGIYNLINDSTTPGVTLTINSITHAGATTRGTTFVLDGTSTSQNVVTNLSEGPSAATSAGQGGGITKQGPGTWIIEGPGTFISRSTISINGGLLAIEDPNAFGAAPGVTVTSNATLRIDNVSPTGTGTFTLSLGGTLLMNGTGTINGITMANVSANSATVATASSTNVLSVDSAANKFTGGAIDTVLHIAGPGTVEFTQSANYVGSISVDAGTNQVSTEGALGTGPNLNVSAGGTFDATPVGTSTTYTLDTKALSAGGTGTAVGSTAANLSCDPTSTIDFGSKPITLTFTPAGTSGDTGHPALYCSSGNLAFHGNEIMVNNAAAALGVGTYQLVVQATGAITNSGAFVAIMGGNGLQAGMIAEIQAVGGQLDLVVSAYTPKSLTWIGNDPLLPAEWDRQVSTNWLNGATPTTFNIYDSVTFNSTGAAAGTVFITNVMQPSSLVVDTGGGNYTFNGNTGIGQIAGATSLVKINTGTLVLNAANTYSGGTIISNGVVQLAIDEGVSSTGPTGANDFSISNLATFDLNGHSNTLNGFNGSGTIDSTATGGTATLNFGFNGDSGLFTGVIQNTSGALGIVKDGLGTEILTSSNSYVGPTIINGGTLRVSNTFTLGAGNSPVTINAGNLDMDTSIIVTNLNGAGGGIVNSSTGTNILTVQSGGEYGGVISGKIGLLINGGTLRLDGANTYSNGTIVVAGAGLAVGQAPADPGPGLVIASNNVTISMPAAVNASTTFTPPVTNVDGATVTYTSGETANNWGNAFFGSALTTNIFSGGNMSIGGTLSFSNFFGTVIITNGTVRWFNASAGGDNTIFDFVGTGGCFARDGGDVIHLGALFGNGVIASPSVSFGSTYWIGAKGIDSEFSGTITGSNSLVKVGADTLTLDGFTASVLATDNATFTNYQYGSALTNLGFTTVSNGVLAIAAPNDLTASTTITVANPTAVLDATSMGYVTNFTDSTGTNQDSAVVTNGILTVVASTEVTAVPQVLAGNGAVKGNGVINNGTISPGFAAQGQGGTLTISNALTVNAGATNAFGLSDDPTGLVTPSGVLNVPGTVTLSGSSFVGLSALNGFINPGKYTLMKYGTLVNEGGPVPPGPISNFTLGGRLLTTTRATLVLSNGTGEVDLIVPSLNSSNLVWAGGVDPVAQSTNTWDIATSTVWTNVPAGLGLQFFQQDSVTFDSTSPNNNVVISNNVAPASITINGASNYLFGGTGTIMGDGALTLNGPGYLALTNGANTFRGGIMINGGIVKAGFESGANQNDLALGTSNVTVNAGGELRFGGNGGGTVVNHFITNGITVNGGTVTAWDGQQHLTNSTVTITAAGGTFRTVFSTKNLVLDSPLTGVGNLTIAPGTNSTSGEVVLNNTNNTISGTVTVSNTTFGLTGFAGLSNAPAINMQGGVLDVTAKSNLTWAVISGQTLEGAGMIRGKNVIVNLGGTIAPGTISTVGTLTVTNNNSTNLAILTLNGTTSMNINRGSTPNASLILTRGTNNFGGTLNVNNVGAALQAGDTFTLFTSSLNNGAFTTVNLPALTGGLTWNNTLAANGKITVVAPVVPPTVSPVITNFSLVGGTNILLNGTNGQSGATYYLMMSTNVALPLAQWKTVGTNLGAGNIFSFSGTNAVKSSLGHQFYILSSTNYNP